MEWLEGGLGTSFRPGKCLDKTGFAVCNPAWQPRSQHTGRLARLAATAAAFAAGARHAAAALPVSWQ